MSIARHPSRTPRARRHPESADRGRDDPIRRLRHAGLPVRQAPGPIGTREFVIDLPGRAPRRSL